MSAHQAIADFCASLGASGISWRDDEVVELNFERWGRFTLECLDDDSLLIMLYHPCPSPSVSQFRRALQCCHPAASPGLNLRAGWSEGNFTLAVRIPSSEASEGRILECLEALDQARHEIPA